MPFLAHDDFKPAIKLSLLDQLVESDNAIIDELAAAAVEEMKAYLKTRFNVTTIFAATGASRNKLVLMYCRDIALYHIYSRYTLNMMPGIKEQRYKEAVKWMEGVRDEMINPDGLPASASATAGYIKTGGNEKRVNHQL